MFVTSRLQSDEKKHQWLQYFHENVKGKEHFQHRIFEYIYQSKIKKFYRIVLQSAENKSVKTILAKEKQH